MADDDFRVQPVVIPTISTILSRSTTGLLVLAVLALSGCSSEIEVERETTTASPAAEQAQPVVTERSRTAVAVDLTRGQEPVRMESGDLVECPPDANFVIVEGCVHSHALSLRNRLNTLFRNSQTLDGWMERENVVLEDDHQPDEE